MRRLITFRCNGATLVGTLDEAPGRTGLLIVSGGNELRMGAYRGMSRLAQRVADAGYPVFRFDRRGIGDSEGENRGFESSCPEIAHAAAAFRKAAKLDHLIAFGNCDAATSLILFHNRAAIDRLVLANPWLVDRQHEDLPPPAAIRAHYAARLRDPREWLRLARGGVNLTKLIRGLRATAEKRSQDPNSLSARTARALAASTVPTSLLLATGDHTAVAFQHAYRASRFDPVRSRIRVEQRDTASHSFAGEGDKDWLFDQLLAALRTV
ncbi:hydrolase 1, exosortase A system-associated [Sphingomonas sp. IC-56]|uniref:hydrolase 1, exosortase A system-associated n=1 Tax=Sphingomonas sp. IC-56 TaxID=2898529 RepID=UPI001E609B65|nr:hydrolase 1, exosortase A system-associated [Sphingomonas sp. IC-56]MCD2323963.1 hydrolase 1, exosortase A system-associated [Sphingomonas sp. IC-56]